MRQGGFDKKPPCRVYWMLILEGDDQNPLAF